MSAETAGRERSETKTPTVTTKPSTAAATVARRRQAADRAAAKLGVEQLDYLSDRHLKALTRALIGEMHRRRLQLDND